MYSSPNHRCEDSRLGLPKVRNLEGYLGWTSGLVVESTVYENGHTTVNFGEHLIIIITMQNSYMYVNSYASVSYQKKASSMSEYI